MNKVIIRKVKKKKGKKYGGGVVNKKVTLQSLYEQFPKLDEGVVEDVFNSFKNDQTNLMEKLKEFDEESKSEEVNRMLEFSEEINRDELKLEKNRSDNFHDRLDSGTNSQILSEIEFQIQNFLIKGQDEVDKNDIDQIEIEQKQSKPIFYKKSNKGKKGKTKAIRWNEKDPPPLEGQLSSEKQTKDNSSNKESKKVETNGNLIIDQQTASELIRAYNELS